MTIIVERSEDSLAIRSRLEDGTGESPSSISLAPVGLKVRVVRRIGRLDGHGSAMQHRAWR